jgi:hypothetical protein
MQTSKFRLTPRSAVVIGCEPLTPMTTRKTRSITFTMDPKKILEMDERIKGFGLSRTEYIRILVRNDRVTTKNNTHENHSRT